MEEFNFQKRTDLFGENNKIAREYELLKLAIPHHDEFQEQVKLELLKQFNVEDPVKVLEIGAGTGLTTQNIVKALPNAHITAIDLEENMINQAKEKQNLLGVNFLVSDALAYLEKAADGSLDSVVTAYTLHNLQKDQRSKILKEIFRVLKKDGLFINADKIAPDNKEDYKKIYNKQVEMFDVYDSVGEPDLKKEWVEHFAVDDHDSVRLDEGPFLKELKELGFGGVNTVYREMLEAVIVATKK